MLGRDSPKEPPGQAPMTNRLRTMLALSSQLSATSPAFPTWQAPKQEMSTLPSSNPPLPPSSTMSSPELNLVSPKVERERAGVADRSRRPTTRRAYVQSGSGRDAESSFWPGRLGPLTLPVVLRSGLPRVHLVTLLAS